MTKNKLYNACVICESRGPETKLVVTSWEPNYIADYYCEDCRNSLFEDSLEEIDNDIK
jgi:hypothetical protein